MVNLVVDASMTLAWYFEDEQTPASLDVLRDVSRDGAIVPSLWRLEVGSGFQAAFAAPPHYRGVSRCIAD